MAVVRRNDPERRNVDLCLFRSGADLGFRPNEDGLYQLVLRGLDRANKCVLAAGMNDGRAHGLQRLTPGNQLKVAVFAPSAGEHGASLLARPLSPWRAGLSLPAESTHRHSSPTVPDAAFFSFTVAVAVMEVPTGTGPAKSKYTERVLEPGPGSRVPMISETSAAAQTAPPPARPNAPARLLPPRQLPGGSDCPLPPPRSRRPRAE